MVSEIEQKKLNEQLKKEIGSGASFDRIAEILDSGADLQQVEAELEQDKSSIAELRPEWCHDRLNFMRFLVEKGRNVNQPFLFEGCHITPLMMAVKAGDVPMAQTFIDLDADIDKMVDLDADDRKWRNALIYAHEMFCSPSLFMDTKNRLNMVRLLLENGANVDVTIAGDNGKPLLARAVDVRGRAPDRAPDMFRLLLEHGADINGVDANGDSALFYAKEWCRGNGRHGYGTTDYCVKELRRLGAKDAKQSRNLIEHLKEGYFKRVNAERIVQFIDDDADVNATDEDGRTAVYLAAQSGYKDAIEVLIENNADINRETPEGTALMAAAANGHLEVVDVLLANGVEVNAVGPNEQTAIINAARSGHLEIVETLAAHGATVRPEDMAAVLQMVTGQPYENINQALGQELLKKDNVKTVKALVALAIGQSYENIDKALGKELLKKDNLEVVKALISLGADVNASDEKGVTHLMNATALNRVDVMEVLAANGADLNAQNNAGKTAMHIAAQFEKMEAMNMLIGHNAEVNIADAEGRMPLHLATEYSKTEAVKALVKAGADLFARDASGKTPLSFVKDKTVKQSLMKAGAGNLFKRGRSKLAHMLKRGNAM